MISTEPATRSNKRCMRLPVLLELVVSVWSCWRLSLHPRKPSLDTLSDHLLADIGLDDPGYEQPTWERYIHPQ